MRHPLPLPPPTSIARGDGVGSRFWDRRDPESAFAGSGSPGRGSAVLPAFRPLRLNWGCGTYPEPGWLNSDRKEGPGIDLSCDILHGLPLEDGSIDYAVTIHALPEVPHEHLVPVLRELRRVLRPGGVLRVACPDLVRGVRAYLEGDREYFLVPDEDATSLGGKLVTQLVWYGYTRSLFTADFLEELLLKAGFASVTECGFRVTHSPFPEIVGLDNRERESVFVEAVR